MARGNIEGGFNLAVGEPEFLQEQVWFGPLMDFSTSYPYPTIDGHDALLEELRHLHPGHEIYYVITNGAKQALLAAMYAFTKTARIGEVMHKAPYWPSYPTLAHFSRLGFTNALDDRAAQLVCTTSPNNPDGRLDVTHCDIWDAVYAGSHLYGFDGIKPRYEVAVYSAAKMLGLSGMRIGWLVTRNKSIAQHAANYVEFTTSGVALPTQAYVARALNSLRMSDYVKLFETARKDLLGNGEMFNHYLKDHVKQVQGVPASGTGMFAWFEVADAYNFNEALNRAKIRVVSGPACGGDENWFRMSMGLKPTNMEAALKALKAQL